MNTGGLFYIQPYVGATLAVALLFRLRNSFPFQGKVPEGGKGFIRATARVALIIILISIQ